MVNAGEDEEELYFLIASPQTFLDTPDSAASVREGGLASQIIETVSRLSQNSFVPDLLTVTDHFPCWVISLLAVFRSPPGS